MCDFSQQFDNDGGKFTIGHEGLISFQRAPSQEKDDRTSDLGDCKSHD